MRSSRNLFRFISVRPPVFEEATEKWRLVDERASRRFVAMVEEMLEEGVTYEEARAEAAQRVMESDSYSTRHGGWQELRPHRRALLDLLEATAVQESERPAEVARDALAGVLDQGDLQLWISSDDYAELRQALWWSYIANVVAGGDRAHQRGEMLDWTRILVFLEAIAQDRADAVECARQVRRARVEVPAAIFLPGAREEAPEPEEPEDPYRERLEELRDSLRRHHMAREQLEELHSAKLARIRTAEASPSPTREQRATRVEEDEGGSAEGGMDRSLVPWRLSADDLDGREDLRYELDRLGLPADGIYIGEVAARIDQRMGEETSELSDLASIETVVGIGSTLSMIKRSRRSFDPPSFGARST